MKLSLPTSVLAIAAAANATCISQHAANRFIIRFTGVLNGQGSELGNRTETANALLADNFVEISDSILSLEGAPLGGVTAPSKQAYIDELAHAPADNGINTVNVFVADCNKILWQWNFTGIGSSEYQVKGFNLFTMNRDLQAEKLELEFNSIAWGADTGFHTRYPDGHVIPPNN